MSVSSSSVSSLELPGPPLVALALSLIIYLLSLLGPNRPPALLTGIILVCGAAVQLMYALSSQHRGDTRTAAILLPFGIFWLSLVSFDVFPELGLGRHPGAITMFSYLSLWGLFVAILFLGSFRKNLAVRILYGSLMFSLLSLAMNHLRDDEVFLFVGCLSGFASSFTAVYIAAAQAVNQRMQRYIVPLGHWNGMTEVDGD
jgi:succinate-acetate transporter protein